MGEFREIFNNEDVIEAYKLISEYYVWVEHSKIGTQKIGIRIYKDLDDDSYSYKLSHHYQGSKQATPYTSSSCCGFENEKQAIRGAKSEMFSFYNTNDSGARWVESSSY